MKAVKVVILKVAKVLACNKLYALPSLTNKHMAWSNRTVLFRIGSRNFSFHLGSRSLKSADLECPWCYASENKAFTADRWKELETLRVALTRKTMENKGLAKANALLLMKAYGVTDMVKEQVDAIDRGEGANPRFVLNPDKG